MPRIRAPGSPSAIAAHAREFALLKQLPVGADGTVPAEALSELAAKYGPGKAELKADDLTFEEFAALFAKPSSVAESGEGNCIGWATFSADGELKPWRFARREPRADDVTIQITHAGICHSDIHQARDEWGNAMYPMVPGHEIAGIVTAVGPTVTKFKVGDRVGVGCMVGSCGKCDACAIKGEEQYCSAGGMVGTYNSVDTDGSPTYGGYSTHVLVKESFVLHIPDALPLAHAAPLLCAGITVYSPIIEFGFDKPGLHIGVVGLGGLGHMAVKFLKAFGATVSVISTSPGKKEEALSVLGADHFIMSKSEEEMKAAAGKMDGIIDTVAATHDVGALVSLLKVDSTIVLLGVPPAPPSLPVGPLIFGRKRVAGSLIGGIKATQDMLNFCADKGIACMSEFIDIDYVNTAYDRVVKNDVRYRFVIDIQGSLYA